MQLVDNTVQQAPLLVPGSTVYQRGCRKIYFTTLDDIVMCLDLLGGSRYSCKAGNMWKEGHLHGRQNSGVRPVEQRSPQFLSRYRIQNM